VYLNNSSMEEMVCSDALPRERGEMAKRMTELEAELAALKKGDSEKDKMIAFLEEKADSASRYYNELKEVRTKFAAEKKVLEDALHDASFFGEDKTEDTTELAALRWYTGSRSWRGTWWVLPAMVLTMQWISSRW